VEDKDTNRNEAENGEMADFEGMLREAMQRQAAPLGLKQRVLARTREKEREQRQAQRGRFWMLQRIAATAVLAVVVGGFVVYRHVEEQRKGEEAREQVMLALRITSKALSRAADRVNDVNEREQSEAKDSNSR